MEKLIAEHLQVVMDLYDEIPKIEFISKLIIQSYKKGGQVLTFGNGGSSCDAEHMVGELVSRFNFDRDGLPAICLSSHTSTLTAIGNDYDYESVFSRQVKAYGKKNDIVIGFSTSGTSKNVLAGLDKAKELGCVPILITGSKVKTDRYITLNINSSCTPRIQEAYFLAMHMICEKVENEIFG